MRHIPRGQIKLHPFLFRKKTNQNKSELDLLKNILPMSSSHFNKPPPPHPPPSTTHSTFPDSSASPISSQPAMRLILSQITDSLRTAFARCRPWHEAINLSSFSRPASLSDATIRIRKNISYFRINYIFLIDTVLAFSLFSHPFTLFTLIGLIAAWLLLYLFRPSDQPLEICGRRFSDNEIVGTLIMLTIFVVFVTNVGYVLMSSILLGFGIVIVHGAFRNTEDLFLEERDMVGSGLFSMIGGAATATSGAAAAGPNRVSHV